MCVILSIEKEEKEKEAMALQIRRLKSCEQSVQIAMVGILDWVPAPFRRPGRL